MILFLIVLAFAIFLSAFLWAWGGAEGTSKNWRRIGVPSILTLGALVLGVHNLLILGAFWGCLFGSLTLGYGESSPLAKFYSWVLSLFTTNIKWQTVSFLIRSTVGILYGASCSILMIAKGWGYFACWLWIPILIALINEIVWACIVEEPKGIVVFGKLLTWEELLIGAGVGIAFGSCF